MISLTKTQALRCGGILLFFILLLPIDAQAFNLPPYLKAFPRESYFELQSGAQSIGKTSLIWKEDGERIRFTEKSEMKVTLFGKSQLLVTELDLRVLPDLSLQEFYYKMTSPDSTLEVKGRRTGANMRLEKIQAGRTQIRDIVVQEPLLLAPLIRVFAVSKGIPTAVSQPKQTDASFLEPSALAVIPMSILVTKESGPGMSYQLQVRYLNHQLKSKIRGDGSLIEEVTDIAGLPIIAKPVKREAHDSAVLSATQLDLVKQAKVNFPEIPKARELKEFRAQISGVPLHQFQLNRHRQKLVQDVLSIEREVLPVKSAPFQSLVGKNEFKKYLEAEISIPVFDPAIQRKAREIVGKESDLWKRALKVHDFVYNHLEKKAFVSLPDALEALQSKKGDCNEHAALYTALARAAGVPTRTVVGLVYSDIYQANPEPGFYYHAWVEVFTGHAWVAIDPTWNQIPADATHLAFVEGGADQQIQIASLMGKIRLSPVKEPAIR